MRYLAVCGLVLLMAVPALAQPALKVSLGVRETNTTANIGENGGTANGIEWVDFNGQQLVLDGTWQLFTFDLKTAPLTPFAGASANGAWDLNDGDPATAVTAGAIDSIRFEPAGGYSFPITLWIDELAEYYDPAGPVPGSTVTFGSFEGYDAGETVMFRQPKFSGSTDAMLQDSPNSAGVDDTVAYAGTNSYKVEFAWKNAAPGEWLRLTPFNTPILPNPALKIAGDAAIVTVWMMGVPEPATLALLALGGLAVLRRR